MRGDADGVVAIPKVHEEAVLNAAEVIHEAEETIRSEVRQGVSLRDARDKHRYHALQTRTD